MRCEIISILLYLSGATEAHRRAPVFTSSCLWKWWMNAIALAVCTVARCATMNCEGEDRLVSGAHAIQNMQRRRQACDLHVLLFVAAAEREKSSFTATFFILGGKKSMCEHTSSHTHFSCSSPEAPLWGFNPESKCCAVFFSYIYRKNWLCCKCFMCCMWVSLIVANVVVNTFLLSQRWNSDARTSTWNILHMYEQGMIPRIKEWYWVNH